MIYNLTQEPKGQNVKNVTFLTMAATAILLTFMFAFMLALVTAIPVYFLWNWVVPPVFHFNTITLWQAWGLVFLVRLLLPSAAKLSSEK